MLAMGPILVFLGFFVFVVGTVVGSFLNVCIYRIPWEKSVIWPGSRCPHCWSPIAAMDNIPIVSWLALRGECRQCGAPISPRYPLIELLVGLLFLGLYHVDVVLGERGRYGYEIGLPLATFGLSCDSWLPSWLRPRSSTTICSSSPTRSPSPG